MLPSGIIFGLIIVVALIVIGLAVKSMYKVTKGDYALVVNGMGKAGVIKDGGGLVVPGFQTTRRVPLDNMKIMVKRTNKEALLTEDKMRVDLIGAFYLKVKSDKESIITAAQTLGDKLLDTGLLTAELEDKFVGALRAAAEKISMADMQTNREKFVQQVQDNINADLNKNGIELETFSPTHLDQTDTQYLDPNNINDAEALRKITEVTEEKRKEKNAIEQSTAVSIAKRNQQANKEQLDIAKADETAELEQAQELAETRSKQAAAVANADAEATKVTEETRIRTERQIAEQEIEVKQGLEEKRIASEKEVRAQEITAEQELAVSEEEKTKAIQVAEEDRKKTSEIAEQERKIATAQKQEETSKAEAAANIAQAEEVKAQESIKTAKEVAEAERNQIIEVLAARTEAEREAVGITVTAEAELKAATDRAEALDIDTKAQAAAVVTKAKSESEAILVKAEADEKAYTVEAEGQEKLNAAANSISTEQVEAGIKSQLIAQLPALVEQSAKNLQNIDSIKIVDMGNGVVGGGANGEGGASSDNMPDQIVNATAKHQVMKPMIDEMLSSVGIDSKKSVTDGVSALVTQNLTQAS